LGNGVLGEVGSGSFLVLGEGVPEGSQEGGPGAQSGEHAYNIYGQQEAHSVPAAEFGGLRLLLCGEQAHDVSIGRRRQTLRKLTLRKYDPLVNEHVLFNEVKMPSGKKRT
jgi:hypothetical protein